MLIIAPSSKEQDRVADIFLILKLRARKINPFMKVSGKQEKSV